MRGDFIISCAFKQKCNKIGAETGVVTVALMNITRGVYAGV